MATSRDRGRIRIGTSGWQYDSWRGAFYPEGLARDDELGYLLRRFPTVEVNGTFYSLGKKSDVQRWLEASPGDRSFAVKGSRYITHMKRLADPVQALANFFGQGLMVLGDALGPILWQLSDDFSFDADRLGPFLDALPRDHEDAARLARRHDDRVKEAATEPRSGGRIRHALEARHESFGSPGAMRLIREHGVALVVSDNPGEYPVFEEPTADFMYLRLHGAESMYRGSYSDSALDRWADAIEAWTRGDEPDDADRITDDDLSGSAPRDLYVYFDNDVEAAAPSDAGRLMGRLGLSPDSSSAGTDDAVEE